ncbi:aldehyde dehydrogenase family protein [Spiribacter halobius]|uniref:Aldehyde dehydrogenase n=1 Tax=Sediminicurvatus halobius TaxID=2182432 RepID=A0A2U2MXD4_9GAMM|nr:aldehyde dehydrogenase family protein [Spiribacter halobius]PWG61527.1 aldehyde dehydrogenase [Spiribacter halobius]UEX78006.1 aldehyde dehydrogenase family protein [Spiribacter halobius]
MNDIAEPAWASHVNGNWLAGGETHSIHDPGDLEQVTRRYRLATADDADAAVDAAASAFPAWAGTPAATRAGYVYKLIDLWREHVDEIAESVTREMGKPLAESRSEANRAIDEMRFWAGEALRLGDRTFESARPHTEAYTIRQPIGPVAAVSPWNFPILTPIRKLIPGLVCGCTVVLKPALQAPGAAVLLLRLLERTGLPAGVANLLIGAGRDVGDRLVRHPAIAGITFTGSTDVGIRLGVLAAERNAKVQLEMGGKNGAVVAGYGDVEHAAKEIAAAAFAVSGQRCTAISRVIVPQAERAALEQALVARAEALKVGHGLDSETGMGPLASREQLDKVQHYVALAQQGEGRVLTGGRALEGDGYYYAPTVITDVSPESALATEEIFGPVLVVVPVADREEAIRVHNSVRYGLTSSVFTDDMDFAHAFTRRAEAGMVHVNHGTNSEGHLPFGGWKQSGQGAFGIGDTAADFYTTLKAVYRMHRG